MELSEIGEIAKSEWFKSPIVRPDINLELDGYVIMPNHIHGIIRIGKNKYDKFEGQDIAGFDCSRDAMHGVSTTGAPDTDERLLKTGENKFGSQKKNLSSILRGYKSAVTTVARKIKPDFGWQPRFHDRVIRDEESLSNIRRYIKTIRKIGQEIN